MISIHYSRWVIGKNGAIALCLALAPLIAWGANCEKAPNRPSLHYVPANADTIHWGYFSKKREPQVTVHSGDLVTLETLTHQAGDDYDRMIKGDEGAESVYHWTENEKAVDRRGAGPMDASVYGRGAGEGFGVHILTGSVEVCGAEPGDVLEVQILDVRLRPSRNSKHEGKAYGSNLAAAWGFQYGDLIEEPKEREVITIYEMDATGEKNWARAVYNYQWTPQTDPNGVVHEKYDYPGVIVDHDTVSENHHVLDGIRVPVRLHFGTMGVAPKEANLVDSVPPAYFGGNIDDWRIGQGSTMYYPVSVKGALFSAGDPHAAQGDSELSGTAIETSLTGTFRLILHKQKDLEQTVVEDLDYPLLETNDAWIVHGFSYPNYLKQLNGDAQTEIYSKSSLDKAMRDAFRKMRRFLMTTQGLTEDEAISLMSVAADFGVTQVVDGNWGVHGTLKKSVFAGRE